MPPPKDPIKREEYLKRQSESRKGRIPWNKGKIGLQVAWNKGIPRTGMLIYCACGCGNQFEEFDSRGRKRKYVFGHRFKGKHPSKEIKKGMSPWKKGKTGIHIPWNKGKTGLQVAWNKGLHPEYLQKEKHPMWEGGISFLPYCSKFNDDLKESIRERDNRTCQYCGYKENGEKLSVHHIHYDKENCNPDLISLCRVCNSKANTTREQYEMLFMNKLNERELLFWAKRVE